MALQGTVKFFNTTKGFGFIATDSGDVFVHANDVQGNPLVEGDSVWFDEAFDDMKQKTRASNVTGGSGDPNMRKGAGKGFGGGGKYGGGKGFGGNPGGFGGGFDGGNYGGGQGFGGQGFGGNFGGGAYY